MATTRFEEGESYFMFHTRGLVVHDDDDYAVFRIEKRSGDTVWLSCGQSNKLQRKIKVRGGVEYVQPGGKGTRRLSASQPTWRTPGIGRVDELWRHEAGPTAGAQSRRPRAGDIRNKSSQHASSS